MKRKLLFIFTALIFITLTGLATTHDVNYESYKSTRADDPVGFILYSSVDSALFITTGDTESDSFTVEGIPVSRISHICLQLTHDIDSLKVYSRFYYKGFNNKVAWVENMDIDSVIEYATRSYNYDPTEYMDLMFVSAKKKSGSYFKFALGTFR
ncbi:MAG: hypothetical protein ABEK36_04010 [Candidatus Aenigmatarchaeota archaeon]